MFMGSGSAGPHPLSSCLLWHAIMRIYLVAFTLGASFIAWRFSNHGATHASTTTERTISADTHQHKVLWDDTIFTGHGIAWLAKEFKFLFVVLVFECLSLFPKQCFVSCSHF